MHSKWPSDSSVPRKQWAAAAQRMLRAHRPRPTYQGASQRVIFLSEQSFCLSDRMKKEGNCPPRRIPPILCWRPIICVMTSHIH